jgi:glutamate-1-semialdehyde 2,1-aminomutase
MDRRRSTEAFERAKKSLAGGVSSAARLTHQPLFVERGKGSRLFDVDGNEYIDYVLGYGPLILGHAPEPVIEAIQ